MSSVEREEFVRDMRVAVLAVEDTGERAPLVTPIWYLYDGGVFSIVTERSQRKTQLIDAARRFSLCMQSEQPPYRYVTVEGEIASIDPARMDERRRLAHRYLGEELGEAYLTATQASYEDLVTVRMRPIRWSSVDYGKQFTIESGP
jgi:nitroimidazol reductase NimA-like FMN-containing flavoprotein (pyridoxamine 5'-phosphate oxidase superfamily)